MINYELAIKHFSYDADSGILTRKNGRYAGEKTKPNDRGYIQVHIGGRNYRVHQIAWLIHHKQWPLLDIDHINGIKSDNRICNLRIGSHALNCQNIVNPKKNNKSGYLGVSFSKVMNKYEACLRVNRKTMHLGHFDDPEEAHKAYLEAKRIHHEFCTI
jgi:hypothetical protein